jgi:hypothetical protein
VDGGANDAVYLPTQPRSEIGLIDYEPTIAAPEAASIPSPGEMFERLRDAESTIAALKAQLQEETGCESSTESEMNASAGRLSGTLNPWASKPNGMWAAAPR